MFMSPGSRARPRAFVQAETVESLIPCGRLSLTSGVPITSTDVTGATVLYYVPYNGNTIALFNGAYWVMVPFSQVSISLTGLTANTNWDVFVVMKSVSSIGLELVQWTNDTTRATAITTQNGVDVKSGDPRRRLIGTIRITSVAGNAEDSIAHRFVSNRYNDVLRPMQVNDATATWNYTSATWRQANGNTANQLDCVMCVSRPVQVIAAGCVIVSSGSIGAASGIGLDSVPAASNAVICQQASVNTAGSFNTLAYYAGSPGAGRHYFTWLESASSGAGTATWLGTVLPTVQSGIVGSVSN